MVTIEQLDARLHAQRKVLGVLLGVLAQDEASRRTLTNALRADSAYPPQDGQEDPGAVPAEAFAFLGAYAAEVNALFAALDDNRRAPSRETSKIELTANKRG